MTALVKDHVSLPAKGIDPNALENQTPSPLVEIPAMPVPLNQVVQLNPEYIDEWELVARSPEEFGNLSELMNSIAYHGQSIPVLVRPGTTGRYELIYGVDAGRSVRSWESLLRRLYAFWTIRTPTSKW
jgi:ParB family chromosome partitioning protein